MGGWLKQLIAFVADHGTWAYAAVFAVAMLEAVPLVGSVVPGATIIIALSALVPDHLNAIALVTAAALGAALGDGTAFWLGHSRKQAILKTWPLNKYPELVKRSEAAFARYGLLAVAVGRYIAPIRAFVPVTAGALAMPPARFYPVSLVTAVIWAISHVASGAFGAQIAQRYGMSLHQHGTEILLALVAIVAISLLLRWLWRRHAMRPRISQS